MKLSEIFTKPDPRLIETSADFEFHGITDDSREAGHGVLFCLTAQGRPFANHAFENGSILVLGPDESASTFASRGWIRARSVPEFMGDVAAALHGRPSERLSVVGVTGTNGKTSVSWMIYHIWKQAQIRSGLIGTLGVRYMTPAGEIQVKTGYTTPRSYQLQSLFADMMRAGVERVVMEVSSEALALGRLQGTRFVAAAFTNFTRDHLDFHGTMENYFEAKKLLFASTAANQGRLIVYDDSLDSEGYPSKMVAYARSLDPETVILTRPIGEDAGSAIHENFPASFQRINLRIALEAAAFSKSEAQEFAKGLSDLPSVPGRFEPIALKSISRHADSIAVVDYAHTPDALLVLLKEARNRAEFVITICGCGGNRDPGKRPLMGEIGARESDLFIISDDNPRKEDPQEIRRQMRAGVRDVKGEVLEVADRRAAIRRGLEESGRRSEKCIVVVAGKGHETVQILADRTEVFSDVEEVKLALAAIERGGK
ncbi:MAG: UDP-N-acetylmuramoyl-L-alanyl-D-glutamate--2,6-diaminopimelate ligase [Leptospirales bacterium]|nr:UDP-N-acetylmuramoyl-L-alanyl-D-glutamate--2,6-diaminopimelate ligase [Leptospirales bacterium]